jgi:bifunctional pyridoxal-dependent enzyme with beta-cystathionase and maltose regulon repressor activities
MECCFWTCKCKGSRFYFGTIQRLAYADGENLLGDYIETAKKNTEAVIDASNEVSPEINVEKIKYMLLASH